jgi:hypothetical protein
MKKFVLLSALILIVLKMFAQDCSQYVYMQKGKTIESTAYTGNGAVMGKSVSFVADVTTANGTTTGTVVAENFDRNGKSRGKRNITYKCTGGSFSYDMSSANSQQGGAKFNTGNMAYPAAMKVGDHFNDFNVQMEMNIGGKTVESTSKITDRTVVARESLTTPAGTWDCLKITYNTTVTMQGMNMPTQTVKTTEWYVPNFGIVQFQVGFITTKITAIR